MEKVACENQLYESQVRLNVEQKLRESKESNEAEVKKIKKHSQALEAKLSAEKEAEAEQNK